MEKDKLTCDVETGVCNIMGHGEESSQEVANPEFVKLPNSSKPIQMIYVTDPICCYCWQSEPALRKFMTLYAPLMETRIVMGGLLESWEGFADEGNGIHNPADVGAHWQESAEAHGMPIDGTIWYKEPITSSYPASTLFKQVQQISDTSSRRFLRSLREEVMFFNRNISKDDVLENILDLNNRNGHKMVADMKSDKSKALLEEDLQLARQLGANSFPTVILLKDGEEGLSIPGLQSFETYESALQSLVGEELEPAPLPELKDMFNLSRNLFFKEIEVMYDLENEAVEAFIAHNLPENSYEIRVSHGSQYVIYKNL